MKEAANLRRPIKVTPPSRGILSGAFTLSFGGGPGGWLPNVMRIRPEYVEILKYLLSGGSLMQINAV